MQRTFLGLVQGHDVEQKSSMHTDWKLRCTVNGILHFRFESERVTATHLVDLMKISMIADWFGPSALLHPFFCDFFGGSVWYSQKQKFEFCFHWILFITMHGIFKAATMEIIGKS